MNTEMSWGKSIKKMFYPVFLIFGILILLGIIIGIFAYLNLTLLRIIFQDIFISGVILELFVLCYAGYRHTERMREVYQRLKPKPKPIEEK